MITYYVCAHTSYGRRCTRAEGHDGDHLYPPLSPRETEIAMLFGMSALVTGVPGPHARARMVAVQQENALARKIAVRASSIGRTSGPGPEDRGSSPRPAA